MRVPQDTEAGAMTWSMVLMGLQVTGAFPYTMEKGNQKPKLSIPMLLWSIFVQLISVTGTLVILKINYIFISPTVGDKIMFFSFFALLICLAISPSLLIINSQKILDMIREMGSQEDPNLSPKRKWFRYNFSERLLVLQFCTIVTLSIFNGATKMGLLHQFELIHVVIVNIFVFPFYILSLELMEKTYGHLLQRLSQAADDLLQTASSISLVNNTEKASETLILALHGFQLKVRKIDESRCEAVESHQLVMNVYLVASIVVVVSSCYALLTNIADNGITFVYMILSFSITLRLCRMGDRFIKKVSEVVGDMAVLQKFSVCGWYCLDYSTLLSIVNTVITYLVVLAQVGDMK
ncbi:hypothetical protein Pcinc_023267 [Petrolisthes cinctipes]|uniref:Gustatory receptor n=1 Tax=Petrolisthes cinctipes TaxID=88211 RepID=A0AAE1KER4_PETCI|nr:hypothetical protein Pcinc_023267 [Petrolisthes cinctipes]